MARRAELVAGTAAALAVAALAAAAPAAAQESLVRAMELERQGRWVDAAVLFRAVLQRDPVNAPALLGVERVYGQLRWYDSTLAVVRRAQAVNPANSTARVIEVRVLRARGGEDSAAAAIERWIAAAPRSEEPYRELVRELIADGKVDDAREAVRLGRARLGPPERLHVEMAQVEIAAGNWPRAATEYRSLVIRQASALAAAAFALQPAPTTSRERVLRALVEPDTTSAPRRLAADLLLRWNEPARAWEELSGALPAAPNQRSAALRQFADRARAQSGAAAQRVAAAALEQLALHQDPDEAARSRVESARAYAAAGQGAAARRVLEAMVNDPAAPQGAAASASATLVELAVREGNAAEAGRLLEASRRRLAGGEFTRLAQAVARSWIAGGSLERAEAVIAPDSSLAADEIRGWIALYRGRLVEAMALLRSAGPRAAERDGPAERAAVAALLQAVAADTSRALGEALWLVERGDTAGGVKALVAFARATRRGAAESLFHAARLAQAAGDSAGAEALWSEILAAHPRSSVAAASLLHASRVQAARGDVAGAVRRLETLVLEYPASALVPEARRELDRLRGLVPRS
jgi:hypothetical protein